MTDLTHSHHIDTTHHHIHDLSYDDRYRAILSEIPYSAPGDTFDVSSTERVNDAIHNAQINHPEYANQLSHLDVMDSNYDSVFLKDTSSSVTTFI